VRRARMLTFRSLTARPLRTALSLFGIVLGVAGILAIGSMNLTALDSITELFRNTAGNADLIITSADSDSQGFAEAWAQRTLRVPGVAAAAPLLHVQTLLAEKAERGSLELSFFGASVGGLTLYGIDPAMDPQVREYKLAAGRFLSPDPDAYDIVLVQSYAEENKIKLGKRVALLTPNGVQKLRAVGFITKDGPGQINNGAFGLIPLGTAQKVFNRVGDLDQIDIVADSQFHGSGGLDQLKAALQARLGAGLAVTYPAAQGKRMTQMLGSYQIGLNFLSGIALFVGAFLIYNAFSMTVIERTREFGFMRTLGMTRREVTLQVLVEAALLGVIGSALGVGLGILMARGLTRLMETLLAQQFGAIRMPTEILVTSVVLGLSVTVLAAAIPAWQAGRISPLEALRIRGNQREGWLLRFGWILGAALLGLSIVLLIANPFPYDVQFRLGSVTVFSLFFSATLLIPPSLSLWERFSRPIARRVYGNSGRIGSGNLQRGKGRTTLTVAALMIGVAMIIVVRGMTDSFVYDLATWIRAYIGGDLYVTASVPMRDDLGRRLQTVEGVQAASPVRYFDVKWLKPDGNEEKLNFMAVDPIAHSRVTSFVFSDSAQDPRQALERLAAGGAVFISSVLAEKYGLRKGDTLRLRTSGGPYDFEIAAVVTDFYNQGLVVDGSWDDMHRLFNVRTATAFFLKVQPGQSIATARARIEELYGERDHLTVESNRDLIDRVFTLMNQAFRMFDVLALIAMLVGALGVVNTMTMNVLERTQEIGMLRSIGMTRRQVVMMILAEAGLMGIIGGLLGLAFGIVLSRIFLLSMTAMSGYRLTYVLSPQAIAVGLVISLIISQLSALLPARRAAQLRILEAIHFE
jgi:putative ABC transport system permease protein